MGTTYTVTRTIKCWKRHECVDCGCEFRYHFERKIKGTGSTEAAALKAANKNVDKAVDTEVDVRPCPTCGRVQPDMVGQVKARQHSIVGWLTLPIAALVFILGLTYVLAGNMPSLILAGLFAAAAAVNLLVALGNPNSNLDANVAAAGRWLDGGTLEVTDPGDATKAETPPSPFGSPHLLGVGFGLLAAVVALAPTLYQTVNKLPLNADTKPDVVSPGDPVKVYFPDSIDCVKSTWSATPTVTLLNANDLGGPVPLTAASKNDTWGNSMSVKSSQKHTHPTLWATVRIPPEPRLSGKTVKLKVDMAVRYPAVNFGDNFATQQTNVSKAFDITLAPVGAGPAYGTIWTGGLIVASLLSVGSSFYLRSLAKQLQNSAIRPVVEPIESDDEDDEDEGEDRPRRNRDEDDVDEDDRPRRRDEADEDDRPRRRRDVD